MVKVMCICDLSGTKFTKRGITSCVVTAEYFTIKLVIF